MHKDDVPPDALLREAIAEHFPDWKDVLNEEAYARYRQQQNWHKLGLIAQAGGLDLIPQWMRDDEVSRARRRRELNDAMSTDYGPHHDRHDPDYLREAE